MTYQGVFPFLHAWTRQSMPPSADRQAIVSACQLSVYKLVMIGN